MGLSIKPDSIKDSNNSLEILNLGESRDLYACRAIGAYYMHSVRSLIMSDGFVTPR